MSESGPIISEDECNLDLQEKSEDLYDNITFFCRTEIKPKEPLDRFFYYKHGCSITHKFDYTFDKVHSKFDNASAYQKKHREFVVNYYFGGLIYQCKNYPNFTINLVNLKEQMGTVIFEMLYNISSQNLYRYCKFPFEFHKTQCNLGIDNEIFYNSYGFSICNNPKDRKNDDTWPLLSIIYTAFMQGNDTHFVEAFSDNNYPSLSDYSLKMLYELVAYDKYSVNHRRNIKYQSIIKHLREARHILGSSFILDSFALTAIQAHNLFSKECYFTYDEEEKTTSVVCDDNKFHNENNNGNMFYIFVEFNIYRLIVVFILIIFGLFINVYFIVLLKDSWKLLNCENQILMSSFVGAYLIYLITKIHHYIRPYFYDDFLKKNLESHFENDPGISMVNKTFSLLVWTFLYTFKESGVTIAIEETIFRSMNKLTCIIGFVIMINTFADMLFILKHKGKKHFVSYYKLSSTFIGLCFLGLAILASFIASSIFTHVSIYDTSEKFYQMQFQKTAYLQICKYSDSLINAKTGIAIHSWTSFIFSLFYTFVTVLFLLYYKLEQRTSYIDCDIDNLPNLKVTVYSLVGCYITYVISNGYYDYKNMILLTSEGETTDDQRTFDIAQHAMIFQTFSILFMINPIVQPIFIILSIKEMTKQHCVYWKRFWEIGLYKNITNLLWYPIETVYLFIKNFHCKRNSSKKRKKSIRKNPNIVEMTKKFPKYPSFTAALQKQLEIESIPNSN
uniref:G_PROTEIN_RECEP_F3_4 domain-containing protein n=1 Tax=Strongyloides papillosus TaxID=174720 RepID=A0A0N5CAA4_STREA